MSSFTGSTEKSVDASFLVSLRIAKSGKAHTIGEELLPAAKDMVTCMLGEASAKKLELISLSNNTVQRRIDSMASNVKNKVINHVKSSDFFSIQLDESTDVTNYAQLMVYVRYIRENKTIKEDYLFCEPLSTRTTADEIFNKLDEFFAENGLDWMNCVGFCSGGARAMTGRFGGVATKVKSVAKNCTFMHCSIHRQALAVKRMPEQFKNVLQDAIKVVNFIKSRALNSRLFSNLCSEMGSDHIQLLLHTEVKWLSRGKMLKRLFQLRSEVQLFLMGTDFELRNDRHADRRTLAYIIGLLIRHFQSHQRLKSKFAR
ncbi:zinc finger BED domain-containing protein 5-like [Diabrotica undecimpunctata]|uniref:zinc finger BED domain-containing protein 5-like n=1 Tax=Diabrotica undecimpunctata TaxID=50387 RepID=UPI003B6343BF